MPKKKTVNHDKLLKAIQAETPSKEIMDKFGISTSAQLKSLYLDALVAKGLAAGITGRVKEEKAGKTIVVNKRGSLVISRELVEEMGFKIEDAFSVRKTKSGVSLKKA